MGTLNKVMLIGRLGRDPEERTTAGGTRVSNFTLATDTFHGNNGDKTTEWHRIVVFGKVAEVCNQYLRKGKLVCIEGIAANTLLGKTSWRETLYDRGCGSRVTFLDRKEGDSKATAASRRKTGNRSECPIPDCSHCKLL